MTVTEVIDYFGGIADTARKLSISYQAVQQWVDRDEVPRGRQWEIQVLSNGELTVDAADQ